MSVILCFAVRNSGRSSTGVCNPYILFSLKHLTVCLFKSFFARLLNVFVKIEEFWCSVVDCHVHSSHKPYQFLPMFFFRLKHVHEMQWHSSRENHILDCGRKRSRYLGNAVILENTTFGSGTVIRANSARVGHPYTKSPNNKACSTHDRSFIFDAINSTSVQLGKNGKRSYLRHTFPTISDKSGIDWVLTLIDRRIKCSTNKILTKGSNWEFQFHHWNVKLHKLYQMNSKWTQNMVVKIQMK